MSKEIEKEKQQETEVRQNGVELDDDDLDQALGGISDSTEKSRKQKQPIEMPPIKL